MAKRNAIIEKKVNRDDQFFFATTSGSSGKARICITIDSTGSMGSTIAAVKDKVMKMIEKLAREYPNQFEIQIMFYYETMLITAQETLPAGVQQINFMYRLGLQMSRS